MPKVSTTTLILATRRSPLALRQAEMARAALAKVRNAPWKKIELLELTTTGDKKRDWVLSAKGGKGLFTKELEDALLEGRAHLAVHSSKDLPTSLPEGLTLAGFLPRADPRDVLVRRAEVPTPYRIATGSPRRKAQAQGWWPMNEWVELRGNLDTRLKKIAQGEADATFLAAAGLARLGITEWPGLVFETIPIELMVPAAGQGAIALECRAGEEQKYSKALCAKTGRAVAVERTVLAALGGGCHAASAAHLDDDDRLHIFHEPKGRVVFSVKERNAAKAAASAGTVVEQWLQGK